MAASFDEGGELALTLWSGNSSREASTSMDALQSSSLTSPSKTQDTFQEFGSMETSGTEVLLPQNICEEDLRPYQAEQRYESKTDSFFQHSDDEWSSAKSDFEVDFEWRSEYPEDDHVIEWCSDDDTYEEPPTNQHKIHVLNNIERARVKDLILAKSNNLKLPKGLINKIAEQFNVSRYTISRIKKHVVKQFKNGQHVNVDNRKKGRVGRKRITVDPQVIMSVPLKKRTTLRSMEKAVNMKKSTLHRLVKRGEVISHSSPIKPDLTPTHMMARMKWCLGHIIPATIRTIPRFSEMYNIIHVDEKWFCMSKTSQKFYLAPNETKPYRAVRSRRFIKKVMFIGSVARPQFNEIGEVLFDGKIGIFPFTEQIPAKRRSKNRARGTLETKVVQSITKEVIRQKLIDKVLPAIRQKWPRHVSTTVWIQQDNAKPHITGDDIQFMQAATQDGLDIRLINQPPQRPDLNVLDLGFFRAIQALKEQVMPRNIDQLVEAFEDAFNGYDPRFLNRIFLSLQYVMCEILKVKGNNNYINPHNKKHILEREGLLPVSVELSNQLVQESMEWVQNQVNATSISSSQHHDNGRP
ncbi:uncharacterized protein [Spinacia oleracea]|uniref:DUF7769 domain-containing protein n=1 Tax=Spinacia oleracea TaxID=3562 RepID=A0A9R0K1W4_SPIOL|nr:uncharacterized protein LOC110793906 [Spinacia oleracea]